MNPEKHLNGDDEQKRPCDPSRDIEAGEMPHDNDTERPPIMVPFESTMQRSAQSLPQSNMRIHSAAMTALGSLGRHVSRRLRISSDQEEAHVYDLDGVKISESPDVLNFNGLQLGNSFVRPVGSIAMVPPAISRFFSSAQRPNGPALYDGAGLSVGVTDNAESPGLQLDPLSRDPFGLDEGTKLTRSRIKQYFIKWRGVGDSPLPRPPLVEIAFISLFLFLAMGILSALQFFVAEGYDMDGYQFMVISCGASAVLIFGLPESKMAQPRTIIGGQMISTFVGVSVRQLLIFKDDSKDWFWLSGPVSCSLALALMQLTRTINPPGGAAALAASMLGPDLPIKEAYKQVVSVLLGNTILVMLGLVLNNLRPSRQYPTHWW